MMRYFCDFCNKSGGSEYWMLKHEASCTMNPNRICKCCIADENQQVPIGELIGLIPSSFNDADFLYEQKRLFTPLSEKANHCPACILAALRQSNTFVPQEVFDFKEEMTRWRSENQEIRIE